MCLLCVLLRGHQLLLVCGTVLVLVNGTTGDAVDVKTNWTEKLHHILLVQNPARTVHRLAVETVAHTLLCLGETLVQIAGVQLGRDKISHLTVLQSAVTLELIVLKWTTHLHRFVVLNCANETLPANRNIAKM